MVEAVELVFGPLAWLLLLGNVVVVSGAAIIEFAPDSKCSGAIHSMNHLLSSVAHRFVPETNRSKQVYPR